MEIVYTIIAMLLIAGIFILWCLAPLHDREHKLNKRMRNLMILGEDWYDEMFELQYYEAQSTWALLQFCWKEKSRKFDLNAMYKSELLNNKDFT